MPLKGLGLPSLKAISKEVTFPPKKKKPSLALGFLKGKK